MINCRLVCHLVQPGKLVPFGTGKVAFRRLEFGPGRNRDFWLRRWEQRPIRRENGVKLKVGRPRERRGFYNMVRVH